MANQTVCTTFINYCCIFQIVFVTGGLYFYSMYTFESANATLIQMCTSGRFSSLQIVHHSRCYAILDKCLPIATLSNGQSSDLIDRLNDVSVPYEYKIVSFDVTSLFTKVPLFDLLNFLSH